MRMYIQPSWTDAAEDHSYWSGGNGQYRGDPSINLSTFDSKGRARVEAFSDSAIEALKKKKTSTPLIDRVLPQQRRVRVLTEQLYELEAERKAGLDIQTYSQLRDVLMVKRDRAEVLLQKALSVRPIRSEIDEDSAQDSLEYTPSSGFSPSPNDGYASEEYDAVGVRFVDELSSGNMFKSFLKNTCIITQKVIHYKHKISSYLNELKEV